MKQIQNTEFLENEHKNYQALKPKFTVEELEETLSILSLEKSEYERQINLFNSEYMSKLGGLISEILKLRVVIFDDFCDPEYQNAKIVYEDFEKIHQQQLQDISFSLNDNEKTELKTAYRKASRLCHPDKLDDDKKLEGEAFFKSLSEAYRKQNLNLVKDILLKLEKKFNFPSIKRINDKVILKQKIDTLHEHIAILVKEIKKLKESDVYQLIQTISNMDEYFKDLRKELKAELKSLKSKRKN